MEPPKPDSCFHFPTLCWLFRGHGIPQERRAASWPLWGKSCWRQGSSAGPPLPNPNPSLALSTTPIFWSLLEVATVAGQGFGDHFPPTLKLVCGGCHGTLLGRRLCGFGPAGHAGRSPKGLWLSYSSNPSFSLDRID